MKNISFSKLGEEECEVCGWIKHHECKASHDFNGDFRDCEAKIVFGKCENCDEWVAHIKNANK